MAKQKQQTQKKNPNAVFADPNELKKLKTRIVALTQYFQQIDDLKESIKEVVEEVEGDTGIDKKQIRKLASTMYKNNFSSLQQENEFFTYLYDVIANGRRLPSKDPLEDNEEETEDEQEAA